MTDSKTLLEKYQPREIARFAAEPQIFGARFSACGQVLASGGYDGLVRRWDADLKLPEPLPEGAKQPRKPVLCTAAPLAEIQAHGGWVQALEFHPQEKRVFTADSWGRITCHDYEQADPQPAWSIDAAHDGWITSICVSPDGKWLASCGIDRQVRVWSTLDGTRKRELSGHQETVLRVRFHPGGRFLLSADLRGIVRQWDAETGQKVRDLDASVLYTLRNLQDTGGVRCMAFDAEGKTLACGGTEVQTSGNVTGFPTLLLFDFESGKITKTFKYGSRNEVYVTDVCFHPAGFLIVSTSGTPGTGQFLFQHPENEQPFFESKTVRNIHALSLSPDGRRIALTATQNGSNGNGRRLDKDGKYAGNQSPVHVFELGGAA